jgi:hypothetical protein
MRCHRIAKGQYLAVCSKAQYGPVPVTENVMETHHCDEFQHRYRAPAIAVECGRSEAAR